MGYLRYGSKHNTVCVRLQTPCLYRNWWRQLLHIRFYFYINKEHIVLKSCWKRRRHDFCVIKHILILKIEIRFTLVWTITGIRSKARGGVKNQAKLPASMLKSHDGFLYVNTRTTFTQDEHDQRFHYQVWICPVYICVSPLTTPRSYYFSEKYISVSTFLNYNVLCWVCFS